MTKKDVARKKDAPDTLDLDQLRLSQNFGAQVGVRKALITVPVRKPAPQWFVRVHPDQAWRLETVVLELKDEREMYLVNPDLWSQVSGELVPVVLITAINRQGVVFVWPVRLPGADGRSNAWNDSALEAATLATTRWVRITANLSLGAYEVFEATSALPEPEWPDSTFNALLEIAFKGHYVDSLDHPVVRRLQGAV